MSDGAELVKDQSKKLDNLQDLPKKFASPRMDVTSITLKEVPKARNTHYKALAEVMLLGSKYQAVTKPATLP